MSFYKLLPLEIFQNILSFAVTPTDAATEHYKLGWICQTWRAKALPRIYYRAYIFENERVTWKKYTIPEFLRDDSYVPELISSNIPVINRFGAMHFVRRLEIQLCSHYSQINLLPYMYLLFLDCTADSTEIDAKNKRHCEYLLNLPRKDTCDTNIENALVSRLVNLISVNLPNANKLELKIHYIGPTGSSFSLLVSALNCYISHADICSLPTQGLPLTFDHLSTLSISLTNRSISNLGINVKTLKTLCLSDIPFGLPWFMLNPSSSDIVFENLEKLELSFRFYDDEDSAEDSDPKFHLVFPKLRYLCINNAYKHSKLLEICSFPPHVNNLRMLSAMAGFTQLRDIVNVDKMYVMLDGQPITSKECHELQRWIGKDAVCTNACFKIYKFNWADFGTAYWSGINHFIITKSIRPEDIVQIIVYMPNLNTLTLKKNWYSEKPRKISGIQPLVTISSEAAAAEFETIRKLNSGIKSLYIFNHKVIKCDQPKVEIGKLLLQLTGLKVFATDVIHADEFELFKDRHSQEYPHLSNILLEEMDFFQIFW